MLLPFDLNQSAFLQQAGIVSQLAGFTIKHSSQPVQLGIQYSRAGVVQDMVDPISAIFELKATGNYNEMPVARVVTAAKTGAGTTATYTMLLPVDTEGIRTLLGIDGEGPQLVSTALMGELQVTDATGAQWKSQTLTVTIQNDVVKDGDTDPVVIAPLKGSIAIPNGHATVCLSGLSLPETPLVLCTVHKPLLAATGVRTFTAQPAANDTEDIAGQTYTYKAALTGAANEILIGATLAATQANLVGAIEASSTGGQAAGTTYGVGTAANAGVKAVVAGDTVIVTAINPGAAGNALVTVRTGASGTWFAATLTGGVDGGLNLFATTRNESPTGFTADLSYATDEAGYSLTYTLLLP